MGWKQVRTAAVGGAAVAAVWAIVSLAAPAQEGGYFPSAPPATKLELFQPMLPKEGERHQPPSLAFPQHDSAAPPKAKQEELPRINVPDKLDANVIPAVGAAPADGPRPVASPPPRTASDVPDPPPPVVTVRVRVPADAAPGDDIKYVITVQNTSSADAHAVTVRNPLGADVEKVVKAEPEPDATLSTGKQLVWPFGTLKGGQSKTIELILRHREGATQVKNLAYVKFEHGEAVTTKIAAPTIKVTKTAPKQAVRDESFTVRVLVENTGRVPAGGVRVVETLPASAQVEAITAGGKRLNQPEGQQWLWEVERLRPGERKVIEYRVTPREGKDVFTLTSVSGQRLVADKPAEGRTQVLVPGLEVKLTGPSGVVNPGESAKYEIVVRNTGTLPCTNVKVTGTIPADTKPTMKTDGGQLYRDSVVWQLARLEPGEAQSFRFAVKASTTGRRVVVASATDTRGQRAGQEVATVFSGTAALTWETHFDSHTVQAGKQGVFTVKVKNAGGEAARNVRVRVEVPDAVSVVQVTPTTRIDNGVVAFGAEEIKPYGEATYVLTFKGLKPDGGAYFNASLSADCLGNTPLTTGKSISVISGPK